MPELIKASVHFMRRTAPGWLVLIKGYPHQFEDRKSAEKFAALKMREFEHVKH
jgi:hypothetical protein